MAQTLAGINPEVLKWARETAGHTVADVAFAIKKTPEVVEAWESGEKSLTYVQLEKLAYRLYKRPIAIFFFPEVPEEDQPSQSFRTLPSEELEALFPDTRLALREAQAMQLSLHELTEGANPAPRKIFRDLRLPEEADVHAAVSQVRHYLGVPLDEQMLWSDATQALKNWRGVIQDAGIFVFKRPMKQPDISGFSLRDEEFPLIYLNNSTPHTRQAFSLFHELSHMLLGANGMTKQDDSYIRSLEPRYQRIEVFCNHFAAEFLVPHADFESFSDSSFYDDSVVEALAGRYSVSREVILRRALDSDLVDTGYYERKSREWASQAQRARRGQRGGDYYANQATYLGTGFLGLAFGRFYQGLCTRAQLAEYLNVRAKNLPGLEPFAVANMGHR